jgi:carbon-monoxide dehydrogenase small subunit
VEPRIAHPPRIVSGTGANADRARVPAWVRHKKHHEQGRGNLRVNGRAHDLRIEPRKRFDALREDLRLTGTHTGCEHGVCGACTVLVDGRPVRACLTYAVQMEGHEVSTIESVATEGRLSILQQALHEAHGLQCGFCTPGIVMTFEAFLRQHPEPSEAEIRDALSATRRRTGYQNIVKAIQKGRRTDEKHGYSPRVPFHRPAPAAKEDYRLLPGTAAMWTTRGSWRVMLLCVAPAPMRHPDHNAQARELPGGGGAPHLAPRGPPRQRMAASSSTACCRWRWTPRR